MLPRVIKDEMKENYAVVKESLKKFRLAGIPSLTWAAHTYIFIGVALPQENGSIVAKSRSQVLPEFSVGVRKQRKF